MMRFFKTCALVPFCSSKSLFSYNGIWRHSTTSYWKLLCLVSKVIATEENTFLIYRRSQKVEKQSTVQCSRQQVFAAHKPCVLSLAYSTFGLTDLPELSTYQMWEGDVRKYLVLETAFIHPLTMW